SRVDQPPLRPDRPLLLDGGLLARGRRVDQPAHGQETVQRRGLPLLPRDRSRLRRARGVDEAQGAAGRPRGLRIPRPGRRGGRGPRGGGRVELDQVGNRSRQDRRRARGTRQSRPREEKVAGPGGSPMTCRILLSLALVLGAQDAKSGLQGYRVDPSWPKKPATITRGEVPGVAVDAKDQVWVYTRRAPNLQVYSPGGELVKTWPDLEHKSAHHIKFDQEGNVWLADVGLHTVRKFTPEGKLLLTLGTPGVEGVDETHLNKPTDMAITPAGDIFVSDGYGNNCVVHFDRTGKFVKAWG